MANEIIPSKIETMGKLLQGNRKKIAAALPKHVTPDRILSIAMNEARNTPLLLECDQASFLGAIIKASQLGLEPGGALGQCYLLPFKNNKKGGIYEVQFIVGYKGMLDLAYRSERVSHVAARAVYEGEEFEYEFGLNEKLIHKPAVLDVYNVSHVYCVVFLQNGGKLFDVMNVSDVEQIKKRSKASNFGPWQTDYDAMAKKSVIRRLFKYMPISVELQSAVSADELADMGEQNNGAFIETTGTPVGSKTEQLAAQLESDPEPQQQPQSSPEFEAALAATPDPRMVK